MGLDHNLEEMTVLDQMVLTVLECNFHYLRVVMGWELTGLECNFRYLMRVVMGWELTVSDCNFHYLTTAVISYDHDDEDYDHVHDHATVADYCFHNHLQSDEVVDYVHLKKFKNNILHNMQQQNKPTITT